MSDSGPNITTVSVETDKKITGEHLKTFKNIESLEECINICHMTRNISAIDIISLNTALASDDSWSFARACQLN